MNGHRMAGAAQPGYRALDLAEVGFMVAAAGDTPQALAPKPTKPRCLEDDVGAIASTGAVHKRPLSGGVNDRDTHKKNSRHRQRGHG